MDHALLSPTGCDPAEFDLLAAAASWRECPTLSDLTEETLRRIAICQGMDFATAVLFDRLVRSPRHGPFISRIANRPETCLIAPGRRPPTVAIVPGAFYREDPTSGADGRQVLESVARLGCPTASIPLMSFGSLPENAALIGAWLQSRPDHENFVLVSLSKAGAEMKLALAAAGAAKTFRRVQAWISLSGIYHGTPLMTWLFSQWWRLPLIRLFFWHRGYHFGALGQLERGPGKLLDFELRPPEHLRIIHVVGFPLERHLSTPLARRGYRRLTPLGPNDGGPILLADVGRFPGLVYPVWGADHYLRPAYDNGLVSRLLQFVVMEEVIAGAVTCARRQVLKS
jgi:hypothetical protein